MSRKESPLVPHMFCCARSSRCDVVSPLTAPALPFASALWSCLACGPLVPKPAPALNGVAYAATDGGVRDGFFDPQYDLHKGYNNPAANANANANAISNVNWQAQQHAGYGYEYQQGEYQNWDPQFYAPWQPFLQPVQTYQQPPQPEPHPPGCRCQMCRTYHPAGCRCQGCWYQPPPPMPWGWTS